MENQYILAKIFEHYNTICISEGYSLGTLCTVSKTWADIIISNWGVKDSWIMLTAMMEACDLNDAKCLKYLIGKTSPNHLIDILPKLMDCALFHSHSCADEVWKSASPRALEAIISHGISHSRRICEYLFSKNIKISRSAVVKNLPIVLKCKRGSNSIDVEYFLGLLTRGQLDILPVDLYTAAIARGNDKLVVGMDQLNLVPEWELDEHIQLLSQCDDMACQEYLKRAHPSFWGRNFKCFGNHVYLDIDDDSDDDDVEIISPPQKRTKLT